MGVLNLPWGLTGALLATTYLHSLCASASPSINVGLKASWPSAPYLLELLYAFNSVVFMITDTSIEKLPQTKMQPPTFLSSIESQTDVSQKHLRIKSSTRSSYKYSRRMDICQIQKHCPHTNLRCQYGHLLPGSKHTINTTIRLWNHR
jgi:hypothetical protein